MIIIVTSSAFFFLLSSLVSSLIWAAFPSSINQSVLLIIPIGVLSQWIFRLLFVKGYYRIEGIIRRASFLRSQQQSHNQGDNSGTPSEKTLLFRELNDWTCGISAGVGFGGMHAILLYGTLLASESRNIGTLYQPSCPSIPAILHSAINAFFFSVLDIVFMLISFHGMRMRNRFFEIQGHEREGEGDFSSVPVSNKRANFVLSSVLVFHMVATFFTSLNVYPNGCLASLPLLSLTLMTTLFFFGRYIQPHYITQHNIGSVD